MHDVEAVEVGQDLNLDQLWGVFHLPCARQLVQSVPALGYIKGFQSWDPLLGFARYQDLDVALHLFYGSRHCRLVEPGQPGQALSLFVQTLVFRVGQFRS